MSGLDMDLFKELMSVLERRYKGRYFMEAYQGKRNLTSSTEKYQYEIIIHIEDDT